MTNNNLRLLLARYECKKDYTLGRLDVMNKGDYVAYFKTLELGYNNNMKNESCIPTGIYKIKFNERETSKYYLKSFEVLGVPNRDNILIHAGNTTDDTQGCILIGKYEDITRPCLVDSKMSLKKLVDIVKDEMVLLEIWGKKND